MFSSWSQVKQIEFCKENELIWTSIPLFTATGISKKSNDESTFLDFESMVIFLPLLRVKYVETSLSVLMLWKRSRALSIVKVKFSKSKILSFSRKMSCWSFIRTSPDSNLVVLLAYWFWFHNAREFGRLVSHYHLLTVKMTCTYPDFVSLPKSWTVTRYFHYPPLPFFWISWKTLFGKLEITFLVPLAAKCRTFCNHGKHVSQNHILFESNFREWI